MRRGALALVPVLLVGAGLAACAHSPPPRTLSVVASWSTDGEGATEEERRRRSEAGPFLAVLDAFMKEHKHKIKVNYQGTRDVSQVLRSGADRGRPPDVAVLPRLNDLKTYVQSGDLYPLDDVLVPAEQPGLARQLLQLTPPNGTHARVYGLSVAVHAKSLVWYRTDGPAGPTVRRSPATWAELVALTRDIETRGIVPWCLGMGAQPQSGWPGTDWIEDILLHRSGQTVYQRWAAGQQAWSSQEVREAWQAWGALVGAGRPTRTPLLTNFDVAGRGMFGRSPSCLLDHQGSFIVRTYQGSDPDSPPPAVGFFPSPTFGPTAGAPVREISEDVVGMFADSPEARTLIRFLAGEQARQVWRAANGGLAFTLNAQATAAAHPAGLPRRIAQTLTTATLCRDASDMMPAAMTAAFHSAVLQYLDDPALLGSLLTELDIVRSQTREDEWLGLPCLSPPG
ncbi:carbohydrate ABC transporter substrate-binding protein, CUT1 family [Micromonospora haikouensis]|uniref:Carbohydrate ABC transporter substrate-binding protein, CUT1 family n=1 Tax=Micromonospora haikouensis TaxID=686309 RepID=A0A1C4WLF5_9ACTN|nr:ABC transporter substrate-binding protein [Micromonospora haikouensis]SCE97004.1 carbohydrate ABC transporter substrate-binding protein, CUT1 family [Micromonospora haikouensis]